MATFRLKLELEEIGNGTLLNKTYTLAETEMGCLEYNVATATTDEAVPFTFATGVTTVDMMVITSNYAISYKHNASATAITLDANGVHVLWGTNITSLSVSNASGSTAKIKIWIAG